MVTLLLTLFLFTQAAPAQNCSWTNSPRVSFYAELQAIPVTALVFNKYRIFLVAAIIPAGGGQARPTTPSVHFRAVPKSCLEWETDALNAMAALKNPAVDAVFARYGTP